ncbi:hypothetical protein HDU67_010012 [Dinochytrium kinnereticum]|nr:hypothetical protein HDU67_010012 [Dinochytrium kinnereticum]
MDWSDRISSGKRSAMDGSIIPPDLNDLPETIDADTFTSPDWDSRPAMDSFSEENRVEGDDGFEGMSEAAVGGTQPEQPRRAGNRENNFVDMKNSYWFSKSVEDKINPLRQKILGRGTRTLAFSGNLRQQSWEISRKLADNKCETKYKKTYNAKGQSVYIHYSSKDREHPNLDQVASSWEKMNDKTGVFMRPVRHIGCGRRYGKTSDNRFCTIITCLVE